MILFSFLFSLSEECTQSKSSRADGERESPGQSLQGASYFDEYIPNDLPVPRGTAYRATTIPSDPLHRALFCRFMSFGQHVPPLAVRVRPDGLRLVYLLVGRRGGLSQAPQSAMLSKGFFGVFFFVFQSVARFRLRKSSYTCSRAGAKRETGIKGVYLRSERMRPICRRVAEKETKWRKIKNKWQKTCTSQKKVVILQRKICG